VAAGVPEVAATRLHEDGIALGLGLLVGASCGASAVNRASVEARLAHSLLHWLDMALMTSGADPQGEVCAGQADLFDPL